MTRVGRLGALFVLFAACGGHSAKTNEPSTEDGAGIGGANSASAGASSVDTGGASMPIDSARAGDDEQAGGEDQAGAPGYVPHIGSGTRNCESSEYCFGLSCYAPPSFLPTVCVASCEADFDCGIGEVCVRSGKLAPTCYARCEVPGDCEYHFDCLDFAGQGQLLCFPAGWAGRLGELE